MVSNIDLLPDTTAMALRIGAALLGGAVLGINRDLHHKSAGLQRQPSAPSIASVTLAVETPTAFACGYVLIPRATDSAYRG